MFTKLKTSKNTKNLFINSVNVELSALVVVKKTWYSNITLQLIESIAYVNTKEKNLVFVLFIFFSFFSFEMYDLIYFLRLVTLGKF